MLGAKAYLGRLFTAKTTRPAGPTVAILSYGMWARRYGSDQKMVGRQIIINSHLYQVWECCPGLLRCRHEVLPTLEATNQSDVLIPMRFPPDPAEDRGHEDFNIVGKLKPGVTLEQARAEMDTITAGLRQAPSGCLSCQWRPHFHYSAAAGTGCGQCAAYVVAVAGGRGMRAADCMRERCQPFAFARLGTAKRNCDSHRRGREHRGRVIRQLLTESVLLSLCGGGLGVLFAFISIHWTHSWPQERPAAG